MTQQLASRLVAVAAELQSIHRAATDAGEVRAAIRTKDAAISIGGAIAALNKPDETEQTR